METSLHRQLKERYAEGGGLTEQRLGRYRIDVVRGNQLVEIQLSSLSSIRDKIKALLKKHDVLVVKPIIVRKHLVKRKREGGQSSPADVARNNERSLMYSKNSSTSLASFLTND